MNKVDQYLKEHAPSFTPAVVGFCVREDKVLLGVRKTSSLGLGIKRLSGLGGKVGDETEFANETHEEALVRELREEVGIEVKNAMCMGNVRFIFPHKPKWTLDTKIYLIDEWEGEPVETEAIAPEWVSVSDIPWERMWSDNYIWVPKVLMREKIQAVILHGEEGVVDYLFN